jgi:hypothetical protein
MLLSRRQFTHISKIGVEKFQKRHRELDEEVPYDRLVLSVLS